MAGQVPPRRQARRARRPRVTQPLVVCVIVCTLALSSASIMATPAFAKPTPQETIKKLKAQIADLKKQIASLKKENDRLRGTPATTTTTTTRTTVPTNAPAQSPFLAGNAHPTYPAGTPGKVSIVYSSPLEPESDGDLLQTFVVRNNTPKPVGDISVDSTISSGSIIYDTATNYGGTVPAVIEPGQWAYGSLFYEGIPPSNTSVKFSVTSSAPGGSGSKANLQVSSADHGNDEITGLLTNTTNKTVTGFVFLYAVCLDSSGNPTQIESTSLGVNSADIPPNIQHRYSISIYGVSCDSFLVGSTYRL